MYRLLFTIIIVFSSVLVQGSPIDHNTAQQIATNFWKVVSGDNAVIWSDSTNTHGFENFYLFVNVSGKGFVIVSADDCVQPILGYSTNSDVPQILPDHIRSFLNEYEDEITFHKNQKTPATEEIKQLWQSLLKGTFVPQRATKVDPLLTTTWDQYPLYNRLCPTDTSGRHAIAGCVAIATAQVMKYWNWPVTGIGTHGYVDYSFGYQFADFGATTYDWANMPNSLDYNSTDEQVEAIATLAYHVGVAVEMNYGTLSNGSYAYTNSYGNSSLPCSENALKDYFKYKKTIHSVYRNQTSDEDWNTTLIHELNAGRPIIERGDGNGNNGHAFVCDGYDDNGLFHINWGWGGFCDGYFSQNALNPTNFTDQNYSERKAIVVGIEPEGLLYCYPQEISFAKEGGQSMFTVVPNGEEDNWKAVSDCAWLNITPSSGGNSVQEVVVTAAQNNTGNDRMATITVTQSDQITTVQIFQLCCSSSDMCTVTLQLGNDHYPYYGWSEGGSITLSNSSGYKYGSLLLNENLSSKQFDVCPTELIITCKFPENNPDSYDYFTYPLTLYNDDVLLYVPYSTSGTYVVPKPCEIPSKEVQIYSYNDKIVVKGAVGLSVEIFDIMGRLVAEEQICQSHQVFTMNHSGIYIVRTSDGTVKKTNVMH